jgi:hypothetical protein
LNVTRRFSRHQLSLALAEKENMDSFVFLPFHDAVLCSIMVEWKEAKCILELSAFLDRDQEARSCRVVFLDVTKVVVPHQEPWGPSVHINEVFQPSPKEFRIEMQSGDELQIEAEEVCFEPIS